MIRVLHIQDPKYSGVLSVQSDDFILKSVSKQTLVGDAVPRCFLEHSQMITSSEVTALI